MHEERNICLNITGDTDCHVKQKHGRGSIDIHGEALKNKLMGN
jgi:hypothetical protein